MQKKTESSPQILMKLLNTLQNVLTVFVLVANVKVDGEPCRICKSSFLFASPNIAHQAKYKSKLLMQRAIRQNNSIY